MEHGISKGSGRRIDFAVLTHRRWWTTTDRRLVTAYAAEGLSLARTAIALAEFHQIKVTRNSLGAFASREGIKFHGEYGPPYGNINKTGKPSRTQEEIRQYNRDRMRQKRAQARTLAEERSCHD